MAKQNSIYSDAVKGDFKGIIPLIEEGLSQYGYWRTRALSPTQRLPYVDGLRELGYKAEISRYGYITVKRK